MQINLRGADVGMAQQLLDRPEIGAPVQQVGGERMSEDMGRHARRRLRLTRWFEVGAV